LDEMTELARRQAEEHPLIREETFTSLPERVLHLIHERAYEEALARSDGLDVLDLGCNTGYGLQKLARVARRAVGADVNRAALAEARIRLGQEAELVLVDGIRLPFPDASFDLGTSFQVVEHVDDPAPYLAEICRVLRPGGAAMFTTPNAVIRLDPGMPPWNTFHVREYSPRELPGVFVPFFREVEVRGMFATPAVYDVEFARVDAARVAHTRRQLGLTARPSGRRRPLPLRVLRRILPEPVAAALRAIRAGLRRLTGRPPVDRRAAAPKPAPPALDPASLSIGDLWYSTEDLDRALDLIAICRGPRRADPA
jgi:SAM-dependent methyltransferase